MQQRPKENAIVEGVIWKQLLLFFFPLLAGTFFQTLYNTVDAIVVGRFVGKEGLSAVGGAAAVIINLLVGFFVGISSGATVVIAQYYGAKRDDDIEKAVHTAIAIAIAGGLIMNLICLIIAPNLLGIMNTPAETIADSALYLRIYAFGMIPNMIYNMGSGILRAVGDSRHPTYFLIAGALANIVLDLVTVLVFHMGVAGAALATIVSQMVSALLTVLLLMRTRDSYRLTLRHIRFEKVYAAKILGIGIPAGLRSSMYSISNIVIQTAINGFGTDTVAAWAAWGKIDSIYWMVIASLGTATTTFIGQNYGAGKNKRVRQCTRVSLGMAAAVSLLFSLLFRNYAQVLMHAFTEDSSVLLIGRTIAVYLSRFYLTYICIEILSAVLIGMGDALIPTIITILGVCVLRIVWNLTAVPHWHSLRTVLFNYPLTWTVTSTAFLIYYEVYTARHRIR